MDIDENDILFTNAFINTPNDDTDKRLTSGIDYENEFKKHF